jgi:hypothetical protein
MSLMAEAFDDSYYLIASTLYNVYDERLYAYGYNDCVQGEKPQAESIHRAYMEGWRDAEVDTGCVPAPNPID